MKIVSSFRDYYDGCADSNSTSDPIFVREPKILNCDQLDCFIGLPSGYIQPHHFQAPVYAVEGELLGFCGRVFPMLSIGPFPDNEGNKENLIRAVIDKDECRISGRGPKWKTFFSAESFKEHFQSVLALAPSTSPRWEIHRFRYGQSLNRYIDIIGSPRTGYDIDYLKLADFFSPNHWQETSQDLFQALGVPIFRATPDMIEISPQLQRFRFFEIVDPFSVCQELSHYLSSTNK